MESTAESKTREPAQACHVLGLNPFGEVLLHVVKRRLQTRKDGRCCRSRQLVGNIGGWKVRSSRLNRGTGNLRQRREALFDLVAGHRLDKVIPHAGTESP